MILNAVCCSAGSMYRGFGERQMQSRDFCFTAFLANNGIVTSSMRVLRDREGKAVL